ncbi:MAG: tyrosine-type recombinase/integrase [Chloroflexota bacterium]|nr:tyrosine-type recombinase/integrase [Chloroflexota bacterium]
MSASHSTTNDGLVRCFGRLDDPLALEGAYQEHGLVFPGPLGGPLDPSVLTHNWEKLARKAGYPGLRLHDLRHAHASGLIRAGVHQLVVQRRLGHASAAFTMQVYGHVAAGLQQQAAQAFAKLMQEESVS